MNERTILEQRLVTLGGLLDTPDGPLGPKAGALAQAFQQRWEAERRLIERILSDAPAGAPDSDLQATIGLWYDRTAAFVKGSGDERPTWTDRQGVVWDAHDVLAIVEDLRERIAAWQDGELMAAGTGVAGADAEDDDDEDDEGEDYG